jgi:Putative transposase
VAKRACRRAGSFSGHRLRVLSSQTISRRGEPATPALCADAHGVSLHAAVRCGAHQRQELECLCRYITRPAIANERLKRNRAGQVVLQLKSAFRDGTTHIVMSPLEFMQRLTALVPRPRLHLIRFHGVLALNAKLRAAIVPSPAENTSEHAHGAPARLSWARLLKRVLDIDIEHCPKLWRRPEDHRRHRRSGGDRQDPHASGLARARAAAGAVPGGLILGQTRFCRSADDLARPALAQSVQTSSKAAPSGRSRDRRIHARGKFSANTARLTTCRAGDIFAGGEKVL